MKLETVIEHAFRTAFPGSTDAQHEHFGKILEEHGLSVMPMNEMGRDLFKDFAERAKLPDDQPRPPAAELVEAVENGTLVPSADRQVMNVASMWAAGVPNVLLGLKAVGLLQKDGSGDKMVLARLMVFFCERVCSHLSAEEAGPLWRANINNLIAADEAFQENLLRAKAPKN